ncbi:myo-inosose-2 dehydratase [Spiroplasma alleghenense]|uniref:Inosose dehydratase n=1 Tax=Spiroplasma alleghenense TaxID=216931 RepID=A0A345Z3G4_9MOLU|nr:myo-inosose-2 dehydratase [Spiroplasma alleghenense]AXK51143.1 inosose dehydratase [Spiroplasma alleghenense]
MLNDYEIKLAIAPIAWTNDDMPELGSENTFEQCISEMSLSGFQGTEIGNKYPKDPKILKVYLDQRNLSVASAWFSAYLTTKPFEEVKKDFIKHRDFLYDLGAKVIVVSEQGHSIQGDFAKSIFKDKPIFSDLQWKSLTTGLELLGDLAHEKDMEIVYHHHMGTGVQTTSEIDRLMKETDESKVKLLLDTGHLLYSGEDPFEIFEKYSQRIKHMHFKDIRSAKLAETIDKKLSFLDSVKIGVFTVPGDGIFDYKPFVEKVKAAKYRGWIVVEAEQDPAVANPFTYALIARNYMKKTCDI